MNKNNEILMLGFGIHVNFTQTPPLSSCSFCNSVFPSCMRDELLLAGFDDLEVFWTVLVSKRISVGDDEFPMVLVAEMGVGKVCGKLGSNLEFFWGKPRHRDSASVRETIGLWIILELCVGHCRRF